MRFFYHIDSSDKILLNFLQQKTDSSNTEEVLDNLKKYGKSVRLPVRISSHQIEEVLERYEMDIDKLQILNEEEKKIEKESFIKISGKLELFDISRLLVILGKLRNQCSIDSAKREDELEEERKLAHEAHVEELVSRVEEALEATKEERFKLQNARKITESLQKHLLEDDEAVRKQLKGMSSCSDFEEVDIERFEEVIRESGGRHSSDSFAVLGSDDPDSFERASPSSESIEDLGHRVFENIDELLKKEMTDLHEENLRLRDFLSVSIDETKLKMMDLQDQLENMTKSMEKSQETVVEKPLPKSKLKKTRPKSLYKKKKSHSRPLFKKNKKKKIDYQDLIDQLDENEAMLKSIERKLTASELEQTRIPQESSYQRAFMWFSSILAAVFASLAVFFAQFNAVHSGSPKFDENLIPKNECLHFILKKNLSEPLVSFRNSTMHGANFKPTQFQKSKLSEKTTQDSIKIEAIKEEKAEFDEEISTEMTNYLLVESKIFEDELLELPCFPEINEESFEEKEIVENQDEFEFIGNSAHLFKKENEIKEDKNFETPVFIDNDDDDYNEDIFFNDRMRLEYMQRMRLGNFYHRAYFHQPAFPNYSRGPMFSHPIGFALNFERISLAPSYYEFHP